MLEWLKSILGDAYTEDIDSKVSAKIGELFVTRSDFNEVNKTKKKLEETLSERDTQLEQLKNSSGDADTLRGEIKKLQEKNEADKKVYETNLVEVKKDSAAVAGLVAAGAKNITAAKALLSDFLKDAELAEDDTVIGLGEKIDSLVSGEGTSFLFEKSTGTPSFKGMKPSTPGGALPGADSSVYETRLAEARKSGNTAAAVAIKREAAENGVILM